MLLLNDHMALATSVYTAAVEKHSSKHMDVLLTVHGDLIRLQLEDLLLEELLLDVTLQVMLSFSEPLKTHLHTPPDRTTVLFNFTLPPFSIGRHYYSTR